MNHPMTQQAHERQRTARTSCGGTVSSGGGFAYEGFYGQPGAGCDATMNNIFWLVFVLAIVVAVVSLFKLNQAHRVIEEFLRRGASLKD